MCSTPKIIPLSDLLPSEPLLLMGAGPVPIPHAVAQANGVVINHLGDTMERVIEGLKSMARYAFQTQSDKIIGVAGPASAAMEMAITNLIWPGRKVLVLKSGTFSGRLGEMAMEVGGDVTLVEAPSSTPITAAMVKEALGKGRFDVVTLVQGETSCGVLNVELPQIIELSKNHGALVIVDAVCTLTTMPLPMDKWDIDVSITGGQKGLSSIPGVSLLAFSKEAWQVVERHPGPRPHWCLDALRAQSFWAHHQYHYTAPVPGILALYEALRLICEETLEQRFKRHLRSSLALQAGLESIGLHLHVPPQYRLASVVAIDLPEGVDGKQLLRIMSSTFGVEIAGAFGLNIVRIGQMGEQCRPHNLFRVLYAIGMSLRHMGIEMNVAAGMATLEQNLANNIESVKGFFSTSPCIPYRKATPHRGGV